jgi:hypothetical protein
VAEINHQPGSREALEAQHGQVWDTSEMSAEFSIDGFRAPFVVGTRKSTGERGSLMFQHDPRFYFSWQKA